MGYNQGDTYEETILHILQDKGIVNINIHRAGAGGGADVKFLHQGQEYSLEVKLDLKADYGQKMLKWKKLDENTGQWDWCKNDEVTDLYTNIDVLTNLNCKNIVPNLFTIPKNRITEVHKQEDQKKFEAKIDISSQALYKYYSNKNCYYIQIGGYGFYHLEKDVLNLGTPQFDCSMILRFRAKTIHSLPIYKYGFYAVLKINGKPTHSEYDIEEKDGRIFPCFMQDKNS